MPVAKPKSHRRTNKQSVSVDDVFTTQPRHVTELSCRGLRQAPKLVGEPAGPAEFNGGNSHYYLSANSLQSTQVIDKLQTLTQTHMWGISGGAAQFCESR